ncbi:MAG: PAS domain S-box protein [Desulfopila sp.]|jgi:PAS domain S-box-containing protein|nr:PAS domain S-box protein [Desulfopila sp.]
MGYKLQDLIDIEHFQNLQDRLNEIYSFPSSIIDNDGNILTATAWQDICTQFHRKNKETEKLCIQSDQYIKDHIHEANPAVSYTCPHGLVDNAAPIIIDGIHFGNFFTGQFFLEQPDLEFFKEQAKKYGFDENGYLEAVKNVPVWSREQLDSYLFYIKGLIAIISESGLKTLKEIENRKQIEARERRHKSILKTAMDGFWLADTEGRLLEVNNAYCSMTGYSEDELLTMCIADLDVEENQEIVVQHIQKVVAQGSDRFESKHLRKDGTVLDVEVSVQFRSEDGGQCVCFIRDISERKLAEQKLRKSEENFRSLSESSSDFIMRYDQDCRHTYMNPAALAASGVSEGDIAGKTLFESGFPLDLCKVLEEKIIQVFETGTPSQAEFSLESVNGLVYLDWRLTPEFDADNQVMSVLGVSRDITERKQAEAELREYSQRLQLATDSGKLAIWDWNVKDNIMFWDERMFELYGITQETFPNNFDAWINGLHPDDKKRAIEECDSALAGEKEFDTSFRVLHPDGAVKFLKANGIVIRDNAGKAVRMIGINSDITEQIQTEEERRILETHLQQAQKMEAIGTLAGGIAHDFNNILGAILGYAEMAYEDSISGSVKPGDLNQILHAGQRAKELVKQILAFSRQTETEERALQPAVIIKEAIKMLRASLPTTIDIQTNIDPNAGVVLADPSQIHQIITNLCTNAFHAMEETGGTLNISLKQQELTSVDLVSEPHLQPGKFVTISVKDTGSGIAPEIMNKIFDPFFTTKETGMGTGMGLAIIHGITKKIGGFVSCKSSLGEGTTFHVYLPVYTTTAPPEADAPFLELPQTGIERILFIDDEEMLAEMGKTMLERLGYSVTVETNSIEALKIIQSQPDNFDLIITDQTMPGMTGTDLAQRVLQIQPGLPIILCTGFSNLISEEKAKMYGIKGFAMKPLAKTDLSKLVRKVLDGEN